MEVTVYDNLNKRVVLAITVAVTMGLVAAFATLFLMPHGTANVPAEVYPILLVPVGMILLVFVVLRMVTSVRIRIERVTGEVFRFYFLLGRELGRRRFNISDFDRISLSRAYRAGYQVSLVGRDQDLIVFATANLRTARDRAEKVAAECGLTVTDQL